MSSDIQIVEQALRGLMTPNNDQIKQATEKLETLMQNKSGLVFCLSQILGAEDLSLNIYAAVLIRKILKMKDNDTDDVSNAWKNASDEMKQKIKEASLNTLIKCNNKLLKSKLVDVVGTIYENIYESKDKWEDALKYIVEGFRLELNKENELNIESALSLFSKVFGYAEKQLLEGSEVFFQGFTKFFKDGSLTIQANTCQAICEILTGYIEKKYRKNFESFIFNILQTILQCFNQDDQNNLRISLFALNDLAQAEPKFLRKSFNDIFILMGKIVEKKDLEEDAIRSVSFEVILSIVGKYPKLLKEDKEKLTTLINAIFKFGMEFEDAIEEDWLVPKSLTIAEENFIPEEKLDEALSLIDRLIYSVGKEVVLPITSNAIMELLGHSNENWKYKYIAYISIGKLSESVNDVNAIEKLIQTILSEVSNENPKIRYSCLYCIAQFSDSFKDSFTQTYHQTVIPLLTKSFSTEKILRCQIQISDALQGFFQSSGSSISGYTQSILDALLGKFIQSDNDCPHLLRETILDSLGELISTVKDDFIPFSEKTFSILFDYFSHVIKSNDKIINQNLFGSLVDLLTKIGDYAKGPFEKNSLDIAQTLIMYQNNISDFKGNIGEFFEAAWERLLPLLKKSNPEFTPKIIESALKVITNPPEVSVASNPSQKIDIKKFVSEVTNSDKKVVLEKEKISLNTTETEEYVIFLELLNLFLRELKEFALTYVPVAEKEAKRVISYPNPDIRLEAAKVFPLLVEIVGDSNEKAKIPDMIKDYLTILIAGVKTEKDNMTVSGFLDAIQDLFKDHDKVLTEVEINQLFVELFGIFDKIETSRIALLKDQDEAEKEISKKSRKPDDDDDDFDEEEENLEKIKDEIEEVEEVLTSYTDVVGSIFKTHRELTMNAVKKMLNEILPKYFDQKSSNFEKKMGLYILDDMVEYLGQELLDPVWKDIAKTLISYTDSTICELRQAGSYGLGQFIQHTKTGYEQFKVEIQEVLNKALVLNSDGQDEDEFYSAQDNVITSLGKMIKYQGNSYNLPEIASQWLGYLPITHDEVECPGMHGLLCDIVIESPNIIFGQNNANVPKIIRVLCRVCETKYSDDEVNKKIFKIIEEMKKNDQFKPLIEKAKEEATKSVLAKINKYFN